MPYVETRSYANGVRLRLTHVGAGSWTLEGTGPRGPTRSGMPIDTARHLADLSAGADPVSPWLLVVEELVPGDQVPCLFEGACQGTMIFEIGPDPNALDGGEALFARCDVDPTHVTVAGVYR